MEVRLPPLASSALQARIAAAGAVLEMGREDLADDVALIVTELVDNAVLHARTELLLTVERAGAGLRLAVADTSSAMPEFGGANLNSVSGRGLLIVERLSKRQGVERLTEGGKVIWVEIDEPFSNDDTHDAADLVALWAEDFDHDPPAGPTVITVEIDVEQLLESRHETDDLIRDLQLLLLDAAARPGSTPERVNIHAIADRVDRAIARFADGRRQIQAQALSAQRANLTNMTLQLHLGLDAGPAATEFLAAMEAADALSAAGLLLVPGSSQPTRDVRRRYVAAIVEQLALT